MHEQMIHFVWKLGQIYRSLHTCHIDHIFSWTNALTLIILKNVSLTEEVNWCRHSEFSQKPYCLQVTFQPHEPMAPPIGV